MEIRKPLNGIMPETKFLQNPAQQLNWLFAKNILDFKSLIV
jgi:hypothetical protein